MKVLELFAGTRSIGKAFEARGHEVFSVEWDKHFENIDLYADIMSVTADDIIQRFGRPDVIWASPDCTTFSIAAISHHRRKNAVTGNLDPVSEYARLPRKKPKRGNHQEGKANGYHPSPWWNKCAEEQYGKVKDT